ncbi:MAG: flavin reductase family protein [Candidatus Aminicenantia bacterium]
MRIIKEKFENFYHFYPYTVAFVGVKYKEKINFMSAAWHSPLSMKPPLFAVMISKKRLTYNLIKQAKEFSISFLPFEKRKYSAYCGRTSGKERDKVKEFLIGLINPLKISSPLIDGLYAGLECTLFDIREYGDHDLIVGEVTAIHEEQKYFDREGRLLVEKVNPILYLGMDFYVTTASDTLEKITL